MASLVPSVRFRRPSSSLETTLDYGAAAIVAASILGAASGSSIQYDILAAGRPARWALLGALGAFALVRVLLTRSAWRLRPSVALALAGYCALCLVSWSWSVGPHATLGRAAGQGLVVFSAAALAGCAARRPHLVRRLLDGVLAAAAGVALASFVYWLVDPSRAFQAASTEYAARFRGIEQNPNTGALLLAIGMPLALGRVLGSKRVSRRGAFGLLLLAFVVEIVASGSRGGLAAGFLSLFAIAALGPLSRRLRVGLGLAVLVSLALSAWVMTIPKALPAPPTGALPAATSPAPKQVGIDAERILPLSGEIGGPWWTHTRGQLHRSLFDTSVRTRAWSGTVERGLGRPLLGYGYGAEQEAFINRYYGLHSGNPENGYVGLFLQIGFVGLALFLAVVVVCLRPGLRRGSHGLTTPAAVGGAAAGLLLGLSESYFHGPGNVAYVAFWVTLLLVSVAGLQQAAAWAEERT